MELQLVHPLLNVAQDVAQLMAIEFLLTHGVGSVIGVTFEPGHFIQQQMFIGIARINIPSASSWKSPSEPVPLSIQPFRAFQPHCCSSSTTHSIDC